MMEMDNLRWIMLGVGLAIIVLIYLFGRKKSQSDRAEYFEPLSADEMPQLSSEDDLDMAPDVKLDDIPFVASDINRFELNDELVEKVAASVDDELVDMVTRGARAKTDSTAQRMEKTPQTDAIETEPEDQSVTQPVVENGELQTNWYDETAGSKPEHDTFNISEESSPVASAYDDHRDDENQSYEDDLIVIHVEAREAYFGGLDLLRVINRQQLKFGDMNIYHAYDENDEIVFSMSNMINPGHFEPEHFAEMRTPGVILFMQLSLVKQPKAGFERMLHCAQALATELKGQLTTANRMRLSEADLEAFSGKAEFFSRPTLA